MTKLYNTALGRDEEQYLRAKIICVMEIKSNSDGYVSGNSTQISIGQFGKLYLNHSWEPVLLAIFKKKTKPLNTRNIFVTFMFASVSYTSPEVSLTRG